MDARGPTSESMEEIILCIGVVLTLSLSTAGQVRTDSSETYSYFSVAFQASLTMVKPWFLLLHNAVQPKSSRRHHKDMM